METAKAVGPRPEAVVGAGLAVAALLAAGLMVLMQVSTYDLWGGMFIAPLLILVSLPALGRQAQREGDRRLFTLLVLALLLKLGAAGGRYFVVFQAYDGISDATGYHDAGVLLARQLWSGDFSNILPVPVGTQFMKVITGVVYMFLTPTRMGGFLFFSWLGFWGLFFFYRAFVVAVPEGRARSYARLVFFLPSLLFWPSSIGKEAWTTLALGIAAFGAAQALTGKTWRGLAVTGLGLWMAGMVRPHFAGMLAVALAAAFVLRRPQGNLGQLAPVAKVISIVAVAVLALLLVAQTEAFLNNSRIDTGGGVRDALGQITNRTFQGGSAFIPSILQSPGRAPIAVATVLFRPFVLEAHNFQAFVAALEGSFLILLCLVRVPWGLAAIRTIRQQPYLLFALVYTGIFIFGFSAVANFGILARQRALLFPLFLVLLAVPPAGARKKDEEEEPSAEDLSPARGSP